MSDGTDYAITKLAEHPSHDVATFLSEANALPIPICDCADANADVEVVGWGPFYHQLDSQLTVRGGKVGKRYDSIFVVRNRSKQVVKGDSGGAIVTADRQLCGLISGYETNDPLNTVAVPAKAIAECVAITHTLQCSGGRCPIVIRRQVQQPMIGFGIPVGPPQSVPIAVPAPRPEPRPEPVYVPQKPTPDPMFTPVAPTDAQIAAAVSAWFGVHGSQLRGPAGPSGQQGPAGERGSGVTQEQVEATVNAWLEANRDAIQGPAGPPGERGLIGVPDSEELAAVIDLWVERNDPKIRQYLRQIVIEQMSETKPVDLSEFDNRVTALEQRKHSQRVLLVDGSAKPAKVLDDETYVDEPIILDVRKFTGASK